MAVIAAARFDRMVPAAPDAIGALRRELRRWARRQGASAAVQANVALAFGEACISIIGPDGPRERPPRPLSVQAWIEGDDLRVNVLHPSRGAGVGLGSGFGMAILARVCDELEVRRRQDRPGTAVQMGFRLEESRPPARSSPPRPSRSTTRR